MRKLKVFNQISVDGYFTDVHGDMSWAHRQDPEWGAFVSGNASGEGVLVFGRITYELMASFWPTPAALEAFPGVAEGMNYLAKIVFSRSLAEATWRNTTLIKGDLEAEVRKLKDESGPDMVIMGSGTIVSQLTQARLIDEFQVVLIPTVLSGGRTMFEGVQDRRMFKLMDTRSFSNGNTVLTYQPADSTG